MRIVDWLRNLDRRIIYAIVFLSLLLPLAWPIGSPVSVSTWTRAVYEAIEGLSPGDTILFAMDISVTSSADELPQATTVLRHLMSRDIRVIFVNFVPTGAPYTADAIAQYEKEGKVYGEDFAHLGYVAGLESGMVAFFADMAGTTPTDARGNRTSSLPIMKGINSLHDVELVVANVGGTPGIAEWVRQAHVPYNSKRLLVNALGPHFGLIEPYIQSKQVVGVLAGSRGAAEYESLTKMPGLGAAMMDSQSIGLMSILAIMILGNIVHFVDKRKAKGGTK